MAERHYAGSPTSRPPSGVPDSGLVSSGCDVLEDSLAAAPSAGFALIDRDWRIVQLSQTRARVRDVESGAAIGKSLWDLYPGTTGTRFRDECERAMRDRVEVRFEQPGGPGDSVTEVTVFPIGEGVGLVTHDITERKRLEEALQRAESEAERLIRLAPSGIFTIMFDPPRFIQVNDAMAALSGYSRHELSAMSPFDLLEEESARRFAERIEQAARTGSHSESVEYTIRHKDGRPLTVVLDVSFVRDPQGRRVGAFVVGHDITERRAAEAAAAEARERVEFLSEANAYLLQVADAEEAIQGIAEALVKQLDCHIFLNYLVEADGQTLRLNASGGLRPEALEGIERLSIEHAMGLCAAPGGGRLVSEDVQNNGDPRVEFVRALGASAYVCQPLTIGERTVGAIAFGSFSRERFTDSELDLVRAVADQVSVAVDRSRAERELERSEERLRTVIENVRDGIATFDLASGTYLFVSQSQANLTGFSRDELLAMDARQIRERVHPDDAAAVAEKHGQIRAGIELPEPIEYRWRVSSGEFRWFSDRMSYVRDADGEVTAVISVSRDITDLKRREKHSRLLVSMTDDFATLMSEEEILDTAGERLGAYLGVAGVHFMDVDEERDGLDVRTLWSRKAGAGRTAVALSSYLTAPLYVAARGGRSIAIADTKADPRTAKKAYAECDAVSIVAVPCCQDGRLRSIFALTESSPRQWSPDEIELVEDVAGRLFPRVERARADAALRLSEARWNYVLELSDALRHRSCAAEIEEAACRMLLERLGATRAFYLVPSGNPQVLAVRQDYTAPGVTSIAGIYAISDHEKILGPLSAGRPFAIDDVATSDVLTAQQHEQYAAMGVRALADYPLMRNDRLMAVLGVQDSEPRNWNDFELALMRETADRAWSAIERTTAVEQLRESLQRTTVLKELASAVASSLDPRQLAETVLATARDLLGAASGNVYLLSAPEGPARAIAHFGYPEEMPDVDEVPIDEHTITGRTVLEGTVQMTSTNPPDGTRATLERFGGASDHVVCIPLVLRGRVIGTLGLSFVDRRRFDENDIDLYEALADQLVVGFENARLFEAEHNIAETLQETLVVLPTRLRGVAFSRAYESATFERGRVGGDFVDIFEVHGHQIGVVMGDVSGKGVDAAVTTSLVRNTIRAHAVDGLTPAELCAKANKVMCRYMAPDEYVTLFFGLLSTRTGVLRYVSAGHPPALVMDKHDTIRELDANSPILGAFDYAPFQESRTVLRRGQKLILYSDGVTEARSPEGGSFYNLGGLKESLLKHRAAHIPGLATRLMDDVIRFSSGVLRDDAALLIVQPTKLRMRAKDA